MQGLLNLIRDCFRRQHPDWTYNENGNWTFTGNTLDNIPDDLRGPIQFVSAPNATEVNLMGCRLKSFDAPNATTVKMIGCRELESFDAPNATIVGLHFCRELKSFEAPNATQVHLTGCYKLKSFDAPNATRTALLGSNQHSQDIIIQQLKNPQNLHYFKVNSKDIAQDIKNADRELNENERVSELRGQIVNTMRPHINVSGNEPSKARKEVKFSQGAMSTIGSFLNPNTIDSLSKVNKKAHDGSLSETCTNNLQGIKEYKKQHIVPKTHAHTAARETVERIINGVAYGR